MAADLLANYHAAVTDADGRGVAARLRELETLLQRTVATINVDAKLLRNMAFSQPYMSYYKSIARGLRKIAERRFQEHRGMVDAKIHPGYHDEILNAALSANGNGLTNYGPITLELQAVAIEDRASVMRENAFDFYERNDLGRRDATEPFGWRSTWHQRDLLGIAHLASKVVPSTAQSDLPTYVLYSGPSRTDDDYIEVHIFGELSWQSLSKITLEKPLTDAKDRDSWDFGSQKLSRRGIAIADRTNP